eukprot:scaffold213003_cov31-Tisochrysis_lutea.AAC.3
MPGGTHFALLHSSWMRRTWVSSKRPFVSMLSSMSRTLISLALSSFSTWSKVACNQSYNSIRSGSTQRKRSRWQERVNVASTENSCRSEDSTTSSASVKALCCGSSESEWRTTICNGGCTSLYASSVSHRFPTSCMRCSGARERSLRHEDAGEGGRVDERPLTHVFKCTENDQALHFRFETPFGSHVVPCSLHHAMDDVAHGLPVRKDGALTFGKMDFILGTRLHHDRGGQCCIAGPKREPIRVTRPWWTLDSPKVAIRKQLATAVIVKTVLVDPVAVLEAHAVRTPKPARSIHMGVQMRRPFSHAQHHCEHPSNTCLQFTIGAGCRE